MIGKLDPQQRQVTVIGGGIAGLLASYYLTRAGYEVTLLEAQKRVGGLIWTAQTWYGLSESAAHSLLASPAVIECFQDLGLDYVRAHPDSKARYVVRNGKLRRVPLNPIELATTVLNLTMTRAKAGDESLDLEAWGKKFLGKSALDYLLNPMIGGIYGAQPKALSVGAAFPKLCPPAGDTLLSHWWKTREQSPRPQMIAPREGMGSLVEALEQKLKLRLGERFRLGEKVTQIGDAGNLVLAVPAHVAASLLKTKSPALSKALGSVEYTGLSSVTAFVEKSSLKRAPKGVGALVPAREKRPILGILFNSSTFPNRVTKPDYASFTVILPKNDSAESIAQSELEALLGLKAKTVHMISHHWEQAVPKYDRHLAKTWELASESWCATPGHVLFGNYTGQLSIRGMIETASVRFAKS